MTSFFYFFFMTSYPRYLQPLEHVLSGTSRLNCCNFHSPGILDQIGFFFFLMLGFIIF